MMARFTYQGKYGEYKNCYFETGYYDNGNLAIEIWSDEGPVCRVTVNTEFITASDEIAIKDYSENEGMVDWLTSIGMIESTPLKIIISGWVEIPVFRLTAKGKELLCLD